jgi:DNA-binding CsgD family transcriptional regulator
VTQGDDLIGRGVELEELRSFVETIGRGENVLVLSGDPGVGKTALLDAASALADQAGNRCLCVRTNEFEAGIGFAALNQCVSPLADHLKHLARPHRSALSIALGLGSGNASPPLVVATALVALFSRVATEQRLLVVLDDLQWVDQASALVLRLVSRRLRGSAVGLLASIRTGWETNFEPFGLPIMELTPLDDTAATALLLRSFPAISVRIRRRVLEEARGNPLAILELPAGLQTPRSKVRSALPAVLPLTERLQELFGSRVDALLPVTREALLAAALDTSGGIAALRVTSVGGSRTDLLRPAERAQLVRVDVERQSVEFRHPLIRWAVVQRSAGDARRRAHRALAEVMADQPDSQAWHLAEATLGADEGVAELLDQAAERVRRRGDTIAAITLLLRAADLSPAVADRGRRTARAAYLGAMDTDLSDASRLLDDPRLASPDRETALLQAAAAGYTMVNGDAGVDAAHRVVVAAVEAHIGDRCDVDEPLHAALQTLAFVCALGTGPELWAPFHQFVAPLSDPTRHLRLIDRIWADPVRCRPSDLKELDAAIDAMRDDDRRRLVLAGPAAYVDRLERLRSQLLRVVRESGVTSPGQAVIALAALCTDGWLSGSWTQLRRWCTRGLRLASSQKLRAHDWTFRYYLGLLAAAAGEHEAARRFADEIGRWSLPRGAAWPSACARHLLGFESASRGDFDEAFDHFAAIAEPGTLPSHAPHALWVSLDLVEAAVRTGRNREAAAHVGAMMQLRLGDVSSRLALLVESAAALVSAKAATAELLAGALGRPSVDHWPFDQARVQLLLGEQLRRNRRIKEGRSVLTTAAGTFRQLGASAWAARAEAELRAMGVGRPNHGARDGPLTAQEFEIAELAASGLTNKQIGQRLIMSPRTVSTHLYNVFPKLGVTSRAALRDALIEHVGADTDGGPETG